MILLLLSFFAKIKYEFVYDGLWVFLGLRSIDPEDFVRS